MRAAQPGRLDPHDRIALRIEILLAAERLHRDGEGPDALRFAVQRRFDDVTQKDAQLRRCAKRLTGKDAFEFRPHILGRRRRLGIRALLPDVHVAVAPYQRVTDACKHRSRRNPCAIYRHRFHLSLARSIRRYCRGRAKGARRSPRRENISSVRRDNRCARPGAWRRAGRATAARFRSRRAGRRRARAPPGRADMSSDVISAA